MNPERIIENYLVARVESAGGIAEKTVSLSGRGFFDRIIVLPTGKVAFVELKKPRGSHTSPHQKIRHQKYRALGAIVAVLKTKADVDRLMDELLKT